MLTYKEFKRLENLTEEKILNQIFEDEDTLKLKVAKGPKANAVLHILKHNRYAEELRIRTTDSYLLITVGLYNPYRDCQYIEVEY